MSKIPTLNEMLKLYTKQDLWERIQQHIRTIDQLKQQLAEKDEEINSLIADYEKRISQEQELMSNLEKQLAEKDEEIERLKFFEKAYYYNQLQASQEDRQKFQNLANQGAVNINYIAIQELEKLRNDIWELDIGDYYLQNGGTIENIKVKRKDVCDLIDKQIKELKGE